MIGSALLNSIPPPERERILRHIADVEIHRGQTLIEAGEDIRCVWFPHDCVTSTIVHTPDGATIEVGIMGLEGMVGLSALFGLEKSNTTVVVQISGAREPNGNRRFHRARTRAARRSVPDIA